MKSNAQIRFCKYQALGNDYLVFRLEDIHQPLTIEKIQRICDRHYGVGADGILVGRVTTEDSEYKLHIYNSDGSEAEISGNGLRIFARYLWDEGFLEAYQDPLSKSSSLPFSIRIPAGFATANVLDDGRRISIEMGRATFQSESIPMSGPNREVINERLMLENETFLFCAVNIGNPHCVVLHPAATREIAERLGPGIENDKRFLNHTNVQFLQVVDPQNLRIEIWERGSGYTLASGSSSCAAAAVARRLKLCDANVLVHNPGGSLEVQVSEFFDLRLTGPVKKVFEGHWSVDDS